MYSPFPGIIAALGIGYGLTPSQIDAVYAKLGPESIPVVPSQAIAQFEMAVDSLGFTRVHRGVSGAI